jgi:hypothetical protein
VARPVPPSLAPVGRLFLEVAWAMARVVEGVVAPGELSYSPVGQLRHHRGGSTRESFSQRIERPVPPRKRFAVGSSPIRASPAVANGLTPFQ